MEEWPVGYPSFRIILILAILYVDCPQIQMGLNRNDTINKESLYSEYI